MVSDEATEALTNLVKVRIRKDVLLFPETIARVEEPNIGGGGNTQFFGGYVPHGFLNVGARERFFS